MFSEYNKDFFISFSSIPDPSFTNPKIIFIVYISNLFVEMQMGIINAYVLVLFFN